MHIYLYTSSCLACSLDPLYRVNSIISLMVKGAPEENGAEENADQIPQRQPTHPCHDRFFNKIIIERPVPFTDQ